MTRLIWMLAFLVVAGASAQVKTRPLTQEEFNHALSVLSGTHIQGIESAPRVEREQAFAVEGAGVAGFQMLPAVYTWNDAATPGLKIDRCGVYLLHQSGEDQFVPSVDSSWKCGGLEAVGFLSGKASKPPRILLLYRIVLATNEEEYPSVLDWDVAAKKYAWNETLSSRMAERGTVTSIAAMKRLLKSYEGASAK
jgi:hypothetical protein